jgi:hypothetical protein
MLGFCFFAKTDKIYYLQTRVLAFLCYFMRNCIHFYFYFMNLFLFFEYKMQSNLVIKRYLNEFLFSAYSTALFRDTSYFLKNSGSIRSRYATPTCYYGLLNMNLNILLLRLLPKLLLFVVMMHHRLKQINKSQPYATVGRKKTIKIERRWNWMLNA